MNTFRSHLAPALGILVIAGLVVSSRHAGAQGNGPGSAPVTIVNPLPVPVAVSSSVPLTATVDLSALTEGEREIVSRELRVGFGGGGGACSLETLEVPSGKRLVIEHVSARGVIASARLTLVGIQTATFQNERDLLFAAATLVNTFTSSGGAFNDSIVSQPAHIYSDEPVQACATVSGPSSSSVGVIISGYFVDK